MDFLYYLFNLILQFIFSKHDLIFLENSFDQKLKQQIMQ